VWAKTQRGLGKLDCSLKLAGKKPERPQYTNREQNLG
jgi:hypothetical protein